MPLHAARQAHKMMTTLAWRAQPCRSAETLHETNTKKENFHCSAGHRAPAAKGMNVLSAGSESSAAGVTQLAEGLPCPCKHCLLLQQLRAVIIKLAVDIADAHSLNTYEVRFSLSCID